MYTQKLGVLKPLIEPIHKRYVAHEDIKSALVLAVQAAEANNLLLNSNDPKYSHISGQDRTPAGQEILKLQQLITSSSQALSTTPKHEGYKVSAADIQKQINITNDSVKKVMSKAVPPPPPPPKAADPAQPSAPPAEGTKMEVEEPVVENAGK